MFPRHGFCTSLLVYLWGVKVSWNRATPKSSISRWDVPWFSAINHPFLGTRTCYNWFIATYRPLCLKLFANQHQISNIRESGDSMKMAGWRSRVGSCLEWSVKSMFGPSPGSFFLWLAFCWRVSWREEVISDLQRRLIHVGNRGYRPLKPQTWRFKLYVTPNPNPFCQVPGLRNL